MKKKIIGGIRYVITIPLIFLLMWGTEIFVRDLPIFIYGYIGDITIMDLIDSIFFIISSALLVLIAYKLPEKYKGVFISIASTVWIMHLYDVHIEYIFGKHFGADIKYALALITTIIMDIVTILKTNKNTKKD